MPKFSYILTGVFSLLAHQVTATTLWGESTTFYPDTFPPIGSSQGKFVSTASGLDTPKVTPMNATAYQWWYFDAVSADTNASVVFLFNTTVNSVEMDIMFPNGTYYSTILPATSATIRSVGQGASGWFPGTGMSFKGTPDLSEYVISVDSPNAGIRGSFKLSSVRGLDPAGQRLPHK
jgi:hypothetical protein